MEQSICVATKTSEKICSICTDKIRSDEKFGKINDDFICEVCMEKVLETSITSDDDLPACEHCGADVYPSGNIICDACMRPVYKSSNE